MTDRGRLDQEQATARLLASRDRPKRQWFIEQLGCMWASRGRCFLGEGSALRTPAAPTEASVLAVQSFAYDPQLEVRIAVAAALGQSLAAAGLALDTLKALLADPHPFVRANAATSIAKWLRWLGPGLDDATVERALQDETWTVRWRIAQAVSKTRLADRGWEAVRGSMPRTDYFLCQWLHCCVDYDLRCRADANLIALIKNRVQTMSDDDFTKAECQKLLAWVQRRLPRA